MTWVFEDEIKEQDPFEGFSPDNPVVKPQFVFEDEQPAAPARTATPDKAEFSFGRLGHQALASVGEGLQALGRAENMLRGDVQPIESDSPLMQRRRQLKQELADDPYYQKRQQAVKDFARSVESVEFPEPLEGSSGIIEDAVKGVSSFAPSMAMTAFNAPLGFAATFGQITGMKHKEYTDQGIDNERSTRLALTSAALQTPIEFAGNVLQLGFLGKMAGAFVKGPGQKAIAGFVTNLIKGIATEGGEEFLQAYPDEIVNIVAANPDLSSKEIVSEVVSRAGDITGSAIEQGKVGGVAGGLLAGGGGIVMSPAMLAQYKSEKQRVIDEKKETQGVNDVVKQVEQSLASGEVTPEQVNAYIQEYEEGHPVRTAIEGVLNRQVAGQAQEEAPQQAPQEEIPQTVNKQIIAQRAGALQQVPLLPSGQGFELDDQLKADRVERQGVIDREFEQLKTEADVEAEIQKNLEARRKLETLAERRKQEAEEFGKKKPQREVERAKVIDVEKQEQEKPYVVPDYETLLKRGTEAVGGEFGLTERAFIPEDVEGEFGEKIPDRRELLEGKEETQKPTDGQEIKTTLDTEMERVGAKRLIDLKPGTPEFKSVFEQYEKQGEDALKQYRELYPSGPVVLSKKQGDRLMGVLIHKNTKPDRDKHPWQKTYWDDRGFSGDSAFATEEEAMQEAIVDGNKIISLEKFDKVSRTKQFLEGVEGAIRNQREHAERMRRPKEAKKEPKGPETKTPQTEIIETFTNKKDGVSAVVAKIEDGYSVSLRDDDAGKIVGYHHIFKNKEDAIKKAQEIVPTESSVKSLINEIKSHIMPNGNLERGLDYYKSRYKNFSEEELKELKDWTQTQNKYIKRRLGGNIVAQLRKSEKSTQQLQQEGQAIDQQLQEAADREPTPKPLRKVRKTRLKKREEKLQKQESGADTFLRHVTEDEMIADRLGIPDVEANRLHGAMREGDLKKSDVAPIVQKYADETGRINLSDLTKDEYMKLFASYGKEGWRTMMEKRYDRLEKSETPEIPVSPEEQNKEINGLINKLESAGLKTDADNIRRSWAKFSKANDKTMMESTIDTAKMILKQQVSLVSPEEPKTGKVESVAVKSNVIGRAWIKNGWKPIQETREIKRGKQKGKLRVTLLQKTKSGKFKTAVVDKDALRLTEEKATEEKPKAEIEETGLVESLAVRSKDTGEVAGGVGHIQAIENLSEQAQKGDMKDGFMVTMPGKKKQVFKTRLQTQAILGLPTDQDMDAADLVNKKIYPKKEVGLTDEKLEKLGVPKFPKKAKLDKTRTLRGAIKKLGGINFLNFKGELKEMEVAVKRLSNIKKGMPIDTAEQALKDDNWLSQDENLLEVLRDVKNLTRDRVTQDVISKKESELTEQEREFREDLDHEYEAPPRGEYIVMDAEDLPTNKKLTIIESKTATGWDVYEVVEKDPFGVTLKNGQSIELRPGDRVQVLKKDLGGKDKKGEKPKLVLEGETVMPPKQAELSAKRRTQSAGRQESLGLIEKAPKGEWLQGEEATSKDKKRFEELTEKEDIDNVVKEAYSNRYELKEPRKAYQVEFDFEKPKKSDSPRNIPLRQKTRMVTTGHIPTGSLRIKSVQDAANLIAGIRKSAQELFYSIATDNYGNVLEIHKYSKGLRGSSQVSPAEVVGRIFNIDGVDRVFFAHNHPSTSTNPSVDDFAIHRRLNKILELKDIDSDNLIIAGTGFVHFDKDILSSKKIQPQLRNRKIPQKERHVQRKTGYGNVSNAIAAQQIVRDEFGNADGFLLLDSLNNILGFTEYYKSTPNDLFAVKIISDIEKSNASALVFSSKSELSNSQELVIESIKRILAGDVVVHDIITGGVSQQEAGKFKPAKVSSSIDHIINVLKTQKGTSGALNDLSRVGADLIIDGHNTFSKFRKEMKRIFSEVWDKVKTVLRKVFNSAKKIVANQKGAVGKDINETIDFNQWLKADKEKKATLNPSEKNVKKEAKRTETAFQREVDAGIRTISDHLHPPQLSLLERILRSPEWYNHDVISSIVEEANIRNDTFHQNFNQFNNSDDAFSAEKSITQLGAELRRKGVSKFKRLKGVVSKEYKELEQILDEGDTDPKFRDFTEAEFINYQKSLGVSEDAINVWKLMQEAFRKQREKLIAPLKSLLAKRAKKYGKGSEDIEDFISVKDDTGVINKYSLKEVIANMSDWKGFYAPRLRIGNWVVKAHRNAGVHKEFYREHKTSKYGANRLAKKLQTDGWTIDKDNGKLYHEDARLREDIMQYAKVKDVAKLLQEASSRVKDVDPQLQSLFNEELVQQLADMIRARGFRGAMLHRTANVVQGYKTDPLERFTRHTANLSAGIAKAEAAEKMIRLLMGKMVKGQKVGGIDAVKEHRAYSVATKYIEEQLRNADLSDRIVGAAKAVTSLKYLGLPNIRAPFINKTAMITTVPAAIHEYVAGGKSSFIKIINQIARAELNYNGFMIKGKSKGLSKGEIAWLTEIREKGYDDPQYTRDAMGVVQALHGKAFSKLMQGSMWLFGKTEMSNRGATLLAGYRIARKMGKSDGEARVLAKEAMEKAHALYGPATLPEWAQGSNPAAKVGQMLYVYQKFGHNWLQMCYDLGVKKKNIRAFMWGVLSPIVLSGAKAVPLYGAWMALGGVILKAMGDDRDPEKFVWDGVRKHLGKKSEESIRYGVAGAAGVNISGSFAVDPGVPKDLMDLTGAIGGAFQDVTLAAHYAASDNPYRAFEVLLPTGFGRILQGIRESQEGATTRKNQRVWDEFGKPYMPSDWETALRLAGFTGAKRSTLQSRQWESKKEGFRFRDRKSRIYEEYRAYLVSKDKKKLKRILEKIRDYNERVRASGRRHIPPITKKSLNNQARRMRKPTKNQYLGLQ